MIAHVDLDAFFASVEQRDHPYFRGKPVIVGGHTLRGVVSTASYEARLHGIHSGMPIFRARRLCPGAIFLPVNFAKYEEASLKFVEICSQYSPTVEQVSLDELYLDLSGTENLGTPWQIASNIQRQVVAKLGITCSVGISAQKTVTKIASGFKKPSGLTEVPAGSERQFLSPLPLAKLPGCGRKTTVFLNNLGINTIGQLGQMDKNHLAVLLGKQGIYLWKVANGQDGLKVNPPQPAKSIGRSTTFPFDTSNHHFIENMLFYLIEKVAADLRLQKVRGNCISVTIRTADFVTTSIQQTIFNSTSNAGEIFQIARQLLYQLWNGTTQLRLIGVSASHLSALPAQAGQTGFNQLNDQFQLFEREEKNAGIDLAIDKIRQKYGFSSINPASIQLGW
ncbi:DNA polymerase IV [Candidatus Microgenomates bacterium]|nr:DNA polymerase IV [Candidatus Microgenomates bacterium]